MFKFLKEKLKGAISRISEGVEKEGKVEEKIIEKPVEEKGFFAKLKEKFVGKEEKEIEIKEQIKPIIKEKIEENKLKIEEEIKPLPTKEIEYKPKIKEKLQQTREETKYQPIKKIEEAQEKPEQIEQKALNPHHQKT